MYCPGRRLDADEAVWRIKPGEWFDGERIPTKGVFQGLSGEQGESWPILDAAIEAFDVSECSFRILESYAVTSMRLARMFPNPLGLRA